MQLTKETKKKNDYFSPRSLNLSVLGNKYAIIKISSNIGIFNEDSTYFQSEYYIFRFFIKKEYYILSLFEFLFIECLFKI